MNTWRERAESSITGIILAGGRGSRMGYSDKASIDLAGQTLLDRRVALLSHVCSDLIVVANRLQSLDRDGYRVVRDVEEGWGSLMGLYSGLQESGDDLNFVTACDMPFLSEGLFRYMAGYAGSFDVVIPRVGTFVEPLFAFYSKGCLHAIRKLVKQKEKRIRAFLDMIRARYVEEADLRRYDPELVSFQNINTKEDLKRARTLLEQSNTQ
jgi:molybdopterin-guanine dinucleotide biosynthesis protein A